MQNLTHNRMVMRTMRPLGALAILAVGAVHLQQYIGADYRAVPTIGPLFLLNAVASAIVGVVLLLPLGRLLSERKADAVRALAAIAAVGIAIGALVALFISESGGLFGFTESGYRAAIVIAIVAEAATVVLLSPVAAVSLVQALSTDGRRRPRAGRATTAGPDRGRGAVVSSGRVPR